MSGQIVSVPTRDGRMPCFVATPDGKGDAPLVIVYMDVWGVREELYDVARDVARHGYKAAVPDLYYRNGRVSLDFRDTDGRTISEFRLDESTRRQVLATSLLITNAMAIADTRALLDFFDVNGPAGSVGYCMGGRHALCAATAWPEVMQATASLHGTMLISDKPDSPHLKAEWMRGEVFCGFAEKDRFCPPRWSPE